MTEIIAVKIYVSVCDVTNYNGYFWMLHESKHVILRISSESDGKTKKTLKG